MKVVNPQKGSVSCVRGMVTIIGIFILTVHRSGTTPQAFAKTKKTKTMWYWGPDQEKAYTSVKRSLTSAQVLYDPNKQLILACDASPWVGAVLSLIMEDGSERPVAFASCSLAESEEDTLI